MRSWNWQKTYCLLLLERGWTFIPKSVWRLIVAVVLKTQFTLSLCAVLYRQLWGKCRVASCSCLLREPNKKHTHNYFQSLKIAPSSHIQQECFLFLCFCGGFPLCTTGTITAYTLLALKARWWTSSVFPLVCLTIAPISVQLLQWWAEVKAWGDYRGMFITDMASCWASVWQCPLQILMHTHKQQNTHHSYDVNLSAFWIQ